MNSATISLSTYRATPHLGTAPVAPFASAHVALAEGAVNAKGYTTRYGN